MLFTIQLAKRTKIDLTFSEKSDMIEIFIKKKQESFNLS